MGFRDWPSHTRIAASVLAWGVILWFFTLGNPSLITVAKFVFIVLILPSALVELLKDKDLVTGISRVVLQFMLIGITGALWYLFLY